MNRTTFLVDGFNLYHSLKRAERDLGQSTKWIDLQSLCTSYLHKIGNNAQLEEVYYFSALAHHLTAIDKYMVKRHQDYINCLKTTGVIVELGRFKKKQHRCRSCRKEAIHHEEKETDVSLALRMFELFMNDKCDTVVFISGDTDLAPAFRHAKASFPTKEVMFAFPYRNRNFELKNLARSFEIGRKSFPRHQFPNQVHHPSGKIIDKPAKW